MNKIAGYFVTGTDTEIGKTLVSGALILKLRAQNFKAFGFKPVVAGTYQSSNGQLLNEDLETLRIASHLPPGQFSLCPYVLNTPSAPHLVAKSEGVRLSVASALHAYKEIQKQGDCIVVEGAGGFLTPLNEEESLGDFAEQIALPVILVVGMKLGCINHALLTIEAIKARNIKVVGWIGNCLDTEMGLLAENIDTLRDRIDASFLGLIPTLPANLQKANNSPYSIEALQFAAEHIQLPNQ